MTRGVHATNIRKSNIEFLLSIIKQNYDNGMATSQKKLVALSCLELGITEKLAREYIRILINAEKIIKESSELGDVLLNFKGGNHGI